MSSKTKIVVLKARELIYTGIFILLGILILNSALYPSPEAIIDFISVGLSILSLN